MREHNTTPLQTLMCEHQPHDASNLVTSSTVLTQLMCLFVHRIYTSIQMMHSMVCTWASGSGSRSEKAPPLGWASGRSSCPTSTCSWSSSRPCRVPSTSERMKAARSDVPGSNHVHHVTISVPPHVSKAC